MKKIVSIMLVSAQLGTGAGSAHAAELAGGAQLQESRMGAFAGAHLKMSLGGEKRRVRGGLRFAPSLHSSKDGATSLRMGEGLEYGFTDRQPLSLSLAGQRIGSGNNVPGGRRQNVSTTGWIAIGAGTVLLAGAVFLGWLVHEADQNTE